MTQKISNYWLGILKPVDQRMRATAQSKNKASFIFTAGRGGHDFDAWLFRID